jgi:hypothetical protein
MTLSCPLTDMSRRENKALERDLVVNPMERNDILEYHGMAMGVTDGHSVCRINCLFKEF